MGHRSEDLGISEEPVALNRDVGAGADDPAHSCDHRRPYVEKGDVLRGCKVGQDPACPSPRAADMNTPAAEASWRLRCSCHRCA